MTANATRSQLPLCASCRSTWIYHRVSNQMWKCRTCQEVFHEPVTEMTAKRSKGSGNIAPPTYRAQLARERLAASAKCDGAAKFNPSGE